MCHFCHSGLTGPPLSPLLAKEGMGEMKEDFRQVSRQARISCRNDSLLAVIYEKAFQVKSTHSSVLSGRSSETLRRSRASGRQIRIL
jgi:hypothetical protein